MAKSWTAVLAIICVPQYIKLMGMEAYGLVGFFSSAQLFLSLFDLGLGATLNRELAMASVNDSPTQETRDLSRTLESIYWAVAVVLGVAWILLAPWLSKHWINARQLPPAQVQLAVTLMGLVLIFQWPFSFYLSGLMGLQHQVLANWVAGLIATLRSFGALVVLWILSHTVAAFFAWQAAVALVGTTAMAIFFWNRLPRGSPPHMTLSTLRRVSAFSLGMTRIALVSLLVMNLDKLLLSRLLTLEAYGYYMLAMMVGSGLYIFASSFYAALYPRFSQYFSQHDQAALLRLYHLACQGLTVTLAPLGLSLAVFSHDALLFWTGNQATADRSATLLTIVVVGCMLNCLMYIPYALTLSHGWTAFAFKQNLVAVLLQVPLLLIAVRRFTAVGAAAVFLALNVGYLFIAMPIMHRTLIPRQYWRWLARDLAVPLGAALAPILLIFALTPRQHSRLGIAVSLVAATAIALVTSSLAATQVRLFLAQAFGLTTMRRSSCLAPT
jgi:O-antigen/teichoic acid export membrane protein